MLRLIVTLLTKAIHGKIISKHLMLRLIDKDADVPVLNDDFKTSYVTVNPLVIVGALQIIFYFKTSYVTVNHIVVTEIAGEKNDFKTSYVTVNQGLP